MLAAGERTSGDALERGRHDQRRPTRRALDPAAGGGGRRRPRAAPQPQPAGLAREAHLHPPLDGRELARRRQRRAGARPARQQLLRQRHELRLGSGRPRRLGHDRRPHRHRHWCSWFSGPHRATYLAALYAESERPLRLLAARHDPGGENRIVMFKSCFPNSSSGGSPTDPVPPIESNPLRGEARSPTTRPSRTPRGSTTSSSKYFATRHGQALRRRHGAAARRRDHERRRPANARAFNDWLVDDWLKGYPHHNVAVFDFFNVLTSNGGRPGPTTPRSTTSAGPTATTTATATGAIEHVTSVAFNYSAYGTARTATRPGREPQGDGRVRPPPERRLPLLAGRRRLPGSPRPRRGGAVRHRGHPGERGDRRRRRGPGDRLGPRRQAPCRRRPDLAQPGRWRAEKGDGPALRRQRDVRGRGATGRGRGLPGLPERHARGLGLHAPHEHAPRREATAGYVLHAYATDADGHRPCSAPGPSPARTRRRRSRSGRSTPRARARRSPAARTSCSAGP